MKAWAESFYNSAAWHKCREAYLQGVGYLCERCMKDNKLLPAKVVHHKIYLTKDNIGEPYITLSRDNLEALCQDCHNREHHRGEDGGLRYSFNDEGAIVPNTPPS